MYYLRTRAAADAIKFTVDQQALSKNSQKPQQQEQQLLMSPTRTISQPAAQLLSPSKKMQGLGLSEGGMSHEEREAQLARMVCSLENKDACLMCGS